jgi:hypothetical protein
MGNRGGARLRWRDREISADSTGPARFRRGFAGRPERAPRGHPRPIPFRTLRAHGLAVMACFWHEFREFFLARPGCGLAALRPRWSSNGRVLPPDPTRCPMRFFRPVLAAVCLACLAPAPLHAQSFILAPGRIPSGEPVQQLLLGERRLRRRGPRRGLRRGLRRTAATAATTRTASGSTWAGCRAARSGSSRTRRRRASPRCSGHRAATWSLADIDNDGDLDVLDLEHVARVSAASPTAGGSNSGWGMQGGSLGVLRGRDGEPAGSAWAGAGSSIAPSLVLPAAAGFLDFSCDCDFGDLDNDGDLDLVHSSYGRQPSAGQVPSARVPQRRQRAASWSSTPRASSSPG